MNREMNDLLTGSSVGYFPAIFYAVCLGAFAWFTRADESSNHRSLDTSRSIEIVDPQNRGEVNGIVDRLYAVVGGEDRIIDSSEKREILDKFGFVNFVFDETQPLKFSLTKIGDGINFYFGSGNFDRYVGMRRLRQVEDYLETVESKKGKK